MKPNQYSFTFYKTFYLYPFGDSAAESGISVLRIEKENRKEICKNKLQIKVMVSKDSWSEDEIKGMSDLRLNNYYKLIYYIPYLGNRILCEDIRKISVYDRNSIKKNRKIILNRLHDYFAGSVFALCFNTDKEIDCNDLRNFKLRYIFQSKSEDLFEDENNN